MKVELTAKDIRTLLAPINERIKTASQVLTEDYQKQFLSVRYTDEELQEVVKEREAEIAYLKGLGNKLAHSQD